MDALSPKLPPWMRFHPPNDKIIDFFLRAKITGNDKLVDFIPETQSCKWEPWNLKTWLELRGPKTNYQEWWFFSPLDLKHRSGKRLNRATNDGHWKVTGKDKKIMSDSEVIGTKTFLVFYKGRGKGEKTNWKIHEYRTTLKELDGTHPGQNAFVLNRLSYEHEKSIKDPNINDARPAVSSPATSTLFLEESESELLLAPVFPASVVQANTTPENCDETMSVTTTAAECDDKHFSARAAGNQLGELTITDDDLKIKEMIMELQQIEACDVLTPSNSLQNNLTVSSATTATYSIEEIESTQGLDLVSPQEYFGGKTLNTKNSYNACAASNEVPEATVNEFEEGLSLSDLPSEPPDCNLSSWNECIQNMFVSQKDLTVVSNKDNGSCTGSGAKMANKPPEWCEQNSYNADTANNEVLEATASAVDLQLEEGMCVFDLLPKPPDCNLDMPFGMPCPVTDDSNKSHCGMDFQYVTNDLATYGYDFQDLKPDYLNANFPSTFGNQKILTLVSIKDSGSCDGPDAKLANAPFESTFQDSGKVRKRKASSELINLESHMVWMGDSSN